MSINREEIEKRISELTMGVYIVMQEVKQHESEIERLNKIVFANTEVIEENRRYLEEIDKLNTGSMFEVEKAYEAAKNKEELAVECVDIPAKTETTTEMGTPGESVKEV